MTDPNARIGLNPVTLRLAYTYLKRGVGVYQIRHLMYDECRVSEVEDWAELAEPILGVKYGARLRVAFYRGGKRIRYVDFSTLFTGGGGADLFTEVTTNAGE